MAWTIVPGIAGKVYVPDDSGPSQKKHTCKACFYCQWCDDTRCGVCRAGDGEADKTDSAESIECPSSEAKI